MGCHGNDSYLSSLVDMVMLAVMIPLEEAVVEAEGEETTVKRLPLHRTLAKSLDSEILMQTIHDLCSIDNTTNFLVHRFSRSQSGHQPACTQFGLLALGQFSCQLLCRIHAQRKTNQSIFWVYRRPTLSGK